MLTVERSFDVRPPPDRVFHYLSDFTHTEQWDPGTLTTTRIDGGSLGLNSRFHNVSRFRGKRTELDYELTRYEPVSGLSFTGTNNTVVATDNFTFVDHAGGTKITYRATFAFKGFARLAELFIRSGLERLADQTIDQLRSALNGLDTPASPGT